MSGHVADEELKRSLSGAVWLIILGITALGGVLRLWDLSAKSFWIDELISLCSADAIQNVKTFFTPSCGNAHPPLYFLLLKAWAAFGQGEFYLRLLPVVFGIAVIPSVFLLGNELLGRRTATIAAFLVAVSPFHLLYDRELRMYSLLTFLTVLSLCFFLKALKDGRWFHWLVYAALSAVNVYVHYFAFLVVLFEWAFFLIQYGKYRHLWKQAICSQAIIAAFFAFWLPGLFYQIQNPALFTLDHPDKFPVAMGAWILKPLYLLFAFSLGQTIMPWNTVAIVGVAVFGTIAVLGIKNLKDNRDALVFILLYLCIPVIVGILVFSSMPRYYVFLAPVYYLVLGQGVASLPGMRAQTVASFALLLPLGVSISNYYRNREFHILAQVDPWREVGNYIRGQARSGDCLVAIGSGRPLGYYTANFEGFARPIYGDQFRDSVKCIEGGAGRRVWVVGADSALQKVTEEARRWFDEHYVRLDEKKFYKDPDYQMKSKFFRKSFLDYRIKVYLYGKP